MPRKSKKTVEVSPGDARKNWLDDLHWLYSEGERLFTAYWTARKALDHQCTDEILYLVRQNRGEIDAMMAAEPPKETDTP